jgi:photosystem II stability/assembly factor-like uncharacterized protein
VQVSLAVFVGALFVQALVVTGSAAGAVSVGHSGWTWGNPSPQGNEIRGLEFVGDRGYAAGAFGTLLRTDDAGSNWTGLSTGLTQNLTRLRVIDTDSLVLAAGCALRRSDDAGQTFSRLPWTASDLRCASGIASLHFPSSEVGYIVVQNGTVLRTVDGGQTWTRKTAVPDTNATGGSTQPTDIFFTAPDTGLATTSGGRIYRTTDGGNSWTLVTFVEHTQLNGVYFFDSSTGYAVGNSVYLLVTTDGGVTWTTRFVGSGLPMTSIRCATATTCLITLGTGDRLLRTTDGGDTISSVTPSTSKIFAAAFASGTRAIAGGALGTTVVSSDAGLTWSGVGSTLGDDFSRLRTTSSSLAFAVGDIGALARTTDGGVNWSNIGVSTSASVLDASFPNSDIGYALDSAGSVLRTDNGGGSWKILNTGTTARPSALLTTDRDHILLVGPRGVRRSIDGGDSFTRVSQKAVAKTSLSDFDRAGPSTFVFGFKALYVSANTGKSWTKLKRPRGSDLQAIDFVTSRRGFALTSDGRIWQTTNRGRRWRELPSIANDSAFELAFSDALNGFAAVRRFGANFNGYVLRTTDGGKTWQPQLIDDDGIDQDGLVAPGGKTALALSLNNSLFATTTGGERGAASSLTLRTDSRRVRRKATIKVTGKLSPAEGGEQVVVAMRGARFKKWRRQLVTVASNGSFTTSWRVTSTSYFVAQWSGDDGRAGDGSKLLTVKIRSSRAGSR